ncbi:MAG: YfcE family phosphodiesterase, partial [Clostridia bacterium]|nr:YfcE family phosphodiesterase [Clostridia bacterium]
GDFDKDVAGLDKKYTVYAVRGNCDMGSKQVEERIVTIDGVKILALHGRKQKVKYHLLALSLYAKEKEVDIALFGHTHIPTERYSDGVLLYNPGSLYDMNPTYGIITIDKGSVKIKTYSI